MITITVKYFKASGKYYTDATYEVSKNFYIEGLPNVVSMDKVVDDFKGKCLNGLPPGLSGWHNEFYCVIECEDGYPVLLLIGAIK